MTIVIVTILALSIITVRRLSRPQAIVAHMNVDQLRNRKRRTMAAAVMVIASVVLYLCSWFPIFFIFNLRTINMYFLNFRLWPQCIDWSSLLYRHTRFSTCCKLMSQSLYLHHIPARF